MNLRYVVVIVVIEVNCIFNSRKLALRQKWVGIKLRNQSGLEDLMFVILHCRYNFHDYNIGFSKHFLTIQHVGNNSSCVILNNG